jgi:precorrin-2 dehydrogenase/sirohydrochlorin ferrochelatase
MTDPEPAPTALYPISLDVTGRACLVVGAGGVAARKARALLDCGALVTVIAPSFGSEMEELRDRLHAVERRAYASGDAARFRLVITATGRPEIDCAVHEDAEAAGVWINSADDRAHSSFILPAVFRDASVTVAVSTSGLSPAFASWLRDRLAAACGDDMGALAALIGEAREQLQRAGRPSDSVDWMTLLDGPLLDSVRAGDWDNARAIVTRAVTR